MSQPRLQLIHCSNGVRTGAKPRRHGRGFRPLVIQGGAPAPTASTWEPVFKLVELGLLVSQFNYLAFLQASVTVMEAYNWTDPKKTG
jgi:hypothetical protein